MNEFKMTVVDTRYEVYDKKTICHLSIICKCITDKICVYHGLATFREGDNYNIELGKKIALAKAERAAYKAIHKRLKRYIPLEMSALESLVKLNQKAIGCIEHNSKYIKEISK